MKRRRRLRRLIIGLSCAAVFVVITWVIATRPPLWYAPPDAADPLVVERAGDVEYDLAVELQQVRDAEARWVLSISEADINAWLAVRLPDWWVQQGHGEWPRELGVPQIRVLENGLCVMALPYRRGPAFAMVTTEAHIALDGDTLHAAIERVRIGQAPMPHAALYGLVRSVNNNSNNSERVGQAISRLLKEGLSIEPVFALADGRRVRAVHLTTRDGVIQWTLCTEARLGQIPVAVP